jgi:biotin-dependent carboxylase-like uncharacterized protein
MDLISHHFANALVGNPSSTVALEFAHVGGVWEVVAESCRIAVTGGNFLVKADGIVLPCWQSCLLRCGQRFAIEGASDAVWGYLAVAGGFSVAPRLGSCATHLRSGLGGIDGRRVNAGDALPLNTMRAPAKPEYRIAVPGRAGWPIRVVLGPQLEFFGSDTVEAFLAAAYRVTHRADRMGTWLEGPPITHAYDYNVVSDGLVPGCIQVPGAGQPVVLQMDCQTIGGYPKLATIITADLPRFAQIRPGRLVNFTAIDIEAAHRLHHKYRTVLAGIEQAVEEVAEKSPPCGKRA